MKLTNVKIEKETDKAISLKFEVSEKTIQMWIPKSAIDIDTFEVADWIERKINNVYFPKETIHSFALGKVKKYINKKQAQIDAAKRYRYAERIKSDKRYANGVRDVKEGFKREVKEHIGYQENKIQKEISEFIANKFEISIKEKYSVKFPVETLEKIMKLYQK